MAGSREGIPIGLNYPMEPAVPHVVVDHAYSLHEGVDGGWSDKRPASVLKFTTEGSRSWRGAWDRTIIFAEGRVWFP